MLSDRSRQALLDICDNIKLARAFTAGFTAERFAQDHRTFYAVTRCLEIISEASRRLDDDLRVRHSQLPWRAIMAAGNFYRHDYDNIAESFVWRTATESLDVLLAMAEAELAGE
ncbi:MAG TPA: HepT-like ribonuclease domain-containing protein [Stellaceae bacterium]|nr:HepT-like ribonuclease domain-containing protein [Stellaceae bacterium]